MPSVTLDKERALRFTFQAFLALEETCKLNVYTVDFRALSPGQVRDLVWAGQLGTPKALTRDGVAKYLPTDMTALSEVVGQVVEAVAESYGAGKQDEAAGT